MDAPGLYRGGTYKKRVDPKEIEKMKKNMKKVPIIEYKSDIYHLKEEQEAEKLLAKIHENDNK